MRLGFLVLRRAYIRVLGSLIEAALARKHHVVLLWDPDEPKAGEALAEQDLQSWPDATRVVYRRGTALGSLLEAHAVSALVGPSLHYVLRARGIEAEAADMVRRGIRFYSVDYLFETLTSEPAGYRLLETTFYVSEYQRLLHWKLMADEFSQLHGVDLQARSVVCGSTMMDQLGLVNRAAVRKQYGFRPDQPVVLLMSLKMEVPDPWRQLVWGEGWRRWRTVKQLGKSPGLVPDICRGIWERSWRGNGYKNLVEAVRHLCQRSGAALVVKSREKNDDPSFLRELADVFVYDQRLFPYTSLELMAVSSLCVHFQSGAVLEAAFAGVPSLSVSISQEHLREYVSFGEVYGGQPGSLQNFPGVVWSADPRGAVALLGRSRLADFRLDYETRRQYVEKFLGFDDTRSSERVLDVIERQLG